MVTLKILLERHPEWANLPIVVITLSGTYDYVGEAGVDEKAWGVYKSEDYRGCDDVKEGSPHVDVLVFSTN